MRCVVILLALSSAIPPALVAQNVQLRALERADQASRTGQTPPSGDDDATRVAKVLELIAQGAVQTPEDAFNAALVLQHTPFDICDGKLVSKSADNYLLAHDLALRAFSGGYADAQNLVAQSIDRYLWMTAGYQRYGTNRAIDQKTGKEALIPIDRSVSDSERAVYGVPPLAQLLKQWPEMARPDTAGH